MIRKVFAAAMVALLAWTAIATAVELRRTQWIVENDPWDEPSRWRLQSRHVEELRSFLQAARHHLPEDAIVGVASNPEDPNESFFRYLWIAYLLPEHELRHAPVGDPAATADVWIAYGTELDGSRFEVIAESKTGTAYHLFRETTPVHGSDATQP